MTFEWTRPTEDDSMKRLVPIVFIMALLLGPGTVVADSIINMPSPPKRKVTTPSTASARKTNPERLALVRYARARTGTYNTYGNRGRYGYHGSGHHYGYHGLGHHSHHFHGFGFHHGVMLGNRPFFFSSFGSVTIHR